MERSNAHSVWETATIPNAGTTSNALRYHAFRSGIFIIPSALTSTTVKFQVSPDNVTWTDLYADANTLISITVAVSRAYRFPIEALGAMFIRLVFGTAEGAERQVQCMLKS